MIKFTPMTITASLALLLLGTPCLATPDTEQVSYYTVENPLPQPRQEVISIELPPSQTTSDQVVTINNKEVPSQTKGTELLVYVDLPANASQTLAIHQPVDGTLEVNYPKKTYAELAIRIGGEVNEEGIYSGGNYHNATFMKLPKTHAIGNKLFKYEGIGWESEQVAYRYYFDSRGAIDIFGKTKNKLSLEHIGLDGDDYHSLNDWGMDILKVGSSLGIGSVAAWINNTLIKPDMALDMTASINSGPLESSATITHKDWSPDEKKINLVTHYSIRAGSNLTQVDTYAPPLKQLATGIVKHGVQVLTYTPKAEKWGYIATYGKQSLNNDNLGMAVFFPMQAFDSFQEDPHNHLVILNNSTNGIHYYFGAYWSASPKGPKSIEDFNTLLQHEITKLNNPLIPKITDQ